MSPEITWTKYVSLANNPLPDDDISVDAVRTSSGNEYELSLSFVGLNTSDAGRYTCEVELTVPQISTVRSSNSSEDLTLQSECANAQSSTQHVWPIFRPYMYSIRSMCCYIVINNHLFSPQSLFLMLLLLALKLETQY